MFSSSRSSGVGSVVAGLFEASLDAVGLGSRV